MISGVYDNLSSVTRVHAPRQVAWLTMLSLDGVVDLNYPWDCLLLEAGFLALFLPPALPLPALAAAAPPLPAVRRLGTLSGECSFTRVTLNTPHNAPY
jgi:hypothetical protein